MGFLNNLFKRKPAPAEKPVSADNTGVFALAARNDTTLTAPKNEDYAAYVAKTVDNVDVPTPPEPAPPVPAPTVTPLHIGKSGLDLIKASEGLELAAYPDPASALGNACSLAKISLKKYATVPNWASLSGNPWTIGYGHTGPEVKPQQTVSLEEAERILKSDIAKFEQGVRSACTVPLTANQFDALVSLAFNIGLGNLSSSTLVKLVNRGNFRGAGDQFLRWNKAQGQVLSGLTIRREKEKALFLS